MSKGRKIILMDGNGEKIKIIIMGMVIDGIVPYGILPLNSFSIKMSNFPPLPCVELTLPPLLMRKDLALPEMGTHTPRSANQTTD